MRALLGVLLAFAGLGLTAGCIDLEGAYQGCVQAGRCGTGGAGGSGGDGGGSSSDGGGSGGGSMDYDGGAPCTSGGAPRLRCDPPIDLVTGAAGVTNAAIAGNDLGFYAGWVTGTSVEVRLVVGTDSTIVVSQPATDAQLALDAQGSRWGAAWLTGDHTALSCLNSDLAASVLLTLPDGGAMKDPVLASRAAGGIGLSLRDSDDRWWGGHSVDNCPASLQYLEEGSPRSNGASVLATASTVGDGFVYVRTGNVNFPNGTVDLAALTDGGIVRQSSAVFGHTAESHASAVSSSGANVLVAYQQVNANSDSSLGFLSTSASFASDGNPITLSSRDPGAWAVAGCGAGCAAVGFITNDVSLPATVAFLSDTPGATSTREYDAICNLPPRQVSGSTIALASSGGRLGIVLTTANAARLYVCDVPPL